MGWEWDGNWIGVVQELDGNGTRIGRELIESWTRVGRKLEDIVGRYSWKKVGR